MVASPVWADRRLPGDGGLTRPGARASMAVSASFTQGTTTPSQCVRWVMLRNVVRLRPTIVIITLVLFAGCSEPGTSGEGLGSGSCGLMAQFEGRSYLGNGVRVIPTYGGPLGRATIPPCGDDDGFSIEAFSIVGVSPKVAFAARQYDDLVFIAEGTDSLPRALQRLRQVPRCIDSDAPISLHGPWLGIIGVDGNTEVDLVPPYDLDMRVDEASAARYERVFLTIHVAESLGQPLTREDVRSSLWKGGTLSIVATCLDGQFWAERVTAYRPA
jgi:Family of unknown function (DUF6281)